MSSLAQSMRLDQASKTLVKETKLSRLLLLLGKPASLKRKPLSKDHSSECFYCKNGYSSRCVKGALLGSERLDGAQAEYVEFSRTSCQSNAHAVLGPYSICRWHDGQGAGRDRRPFTSANGRHISNRSVSLHDEKPVFCLIVYRLLCST